ncbi:MAG: hypothetical protein IKF72_03255 [Kiritimatiellae bacterium]|nr:hypothetical protein [Kiritimatiellia bacterium]
MNVHVIIGADDYLVNEAAKRIVGDGVGLEVVDSLNATNAELQLTDLRAADASFETPPFLDPKKVTWWKNVHFLPGGKKAVADEVRSALEKFAVRLAAATLPENQHFILSGPHLLKTSVFAKRLASAVELVVFSEDSPREAARAAVVRAIDFAGGMGLKFEPGAAERFVATVGGDARSQMSELGKMRDYLGGESSVVTAADVAVIASPGVGVEPEVWDVTDAIGRRDIGAALAAIRRFELGTGFAVFMSGVIERFFRQLVDVAGGRTSGMAPYAVSKAKGFLRNWSLQEARMARWRFLMLRERVVTGTASGDALVVSELVRAMRKGRGR